MTDSCHLENRALVRISGSDAHGWLQGLITNDMDQLSPTNTLYSALLTPQGKVLFDFFVIDTGDDILLDCEANRCEELLKRLTLYKLRSAVEVNAADDLHVVALFGQASVEASGLAERVAGTTEPALGGLAFVDPRQAQLGVRIIGNVAKIEEELDLAGPELGDFADYESFRLRQGIPEGARDLDPNASFALESNLTELNGVSFSKGCFIGQEVTARTKHKSKLRKRILAVQSETDLPQGPQPLQAGASEIGTLLSTQGAYGVGLIRLDRWATAKENNERVLVDGQAVDIKIPGWLSLEDEETSA